MIFGGEAKGFGRDFEFGDGFVVSIGSRWVSRGEKGASGGGFGGRQVIGWPWSQRSYGR